MAARPESAYLPEDTVIYRVLAPLALALPLLACSAPTAGTWEGTMDIGPVDAFALVIELPEKGLEGAIAVAAAPGSSPRRHRICSGREADGRLELEYDAARPDCSTAEGGPALQRRQLRGQLGEDVISGEVFRKTDSGEEKLGFFRAFRRPPSPRPEP